MWTFDLQNVLSSAIFVGVQSLRFCVIMLHGYISSTHAVTGDEVIPI
jgi:hypothetical protein